MNSKERVFATINFEPVDRPAVFPLEGTCWVCRKHGYSYEDSFGMADYGASDIVQGFDEMKSDVVFCGGSAWMAWTSAFGGEIDASRPGEAINVGPAFKPDAIPELSDDEIYDRLINDHYVQSMVNQIKACKKIVGDEKVIMAGHTGPFTGAGTLVGTKKFMVLIAKKKPEFAPLMEFTTRALSIYAGILCDAGIDILNVCDPVSSGDMISLPMYEELSFPYMMKYKELLKKKDMPILVHICGNAGSRVEKVLEFGAKCFSVDTMVDMADMLKRCDHQMCMVGNLNNIDVMVNGTPETVYNESVKLLELGKANGGGLIVCTGCELPPMTNLENIQAIVKAAEDVYA